jgi:hypothetical protein
MVPPVITVVVFCAKRVRAIKKKANKNNDFLKKACDIFEFIAKQE